MAGGVANPTYKKLPYGGRDAYRSFAAFYPFYLGEHSDPACRRLHVAGTSASLALAAAAALTLRPALALAVPVVGYGLAWVGHFAFERNRPATFKHPIYSLLGDLRLWWEVVVTRQRAF